MSDLNSLQTASVAQPRGIIAHLTNKQIVSYLKNVQIVQAAPHGATAATQFASSPSKQTSRRVAM